MQQTSTRRKTEQGFTNTVCGTLRAMTISWLWRNNNSFGSFENKPSGRLKNMLRDQSSAMRNGSLINEGIVSLTIIPIRRLCKGIFFNVI